MSGHSKWSTIKRQKGVTDAKRGQLFTKLANSITLAVKQGGGVADPNTNFKLRLAIDRARSVNMPKDNIDRAIERGMGANGANTNFDEVLYEGFVGGSDGVVFMVSAATDNKNRTTSEIKNIIDKNGGTLGNPGSVGYMFQRRGEFEIDKGGKSSDEIMSVVLDAGAQDMHESDGHILIITTPEDLAQVKKKVEEEGITVVSAEIVYAPKNTVNVEGETQQKVMQLLDRIEDHDDVQNVYTNLA